MQNFADAHGVIPKEEHGTSLHRMKFPVLTTIKQSKKTIQMLFIQNVTTKHANKLRLAQNDAIDKVI
jgi:hypothetical protein